MGVKEGGGCLLEGGVFSGAYSVHVAHTKGSLYFPTDMCTHTHYQSYCTWDINTHTKLDTAYICAEAGLLVTLQTRYFLLMGPA